jgi:hypothetical protein
MWNNLQRLSRRIALFLLPATGACGFILTQGPPQGHQSMSYFTCTESNAGPILDVVWSGLNLLGAIAIASDPTAYYNSEVAIAGGLLWSFVSGTSAGTGFNKTRQCRAAQQQLAQRVGQVGAPPPTAGFVFTIQAVVLNPPQSSVRVGERVQLIATARSSGGEVVLNQTFHWSSSNDAIASVTAAGLVTANATGSVVIAARTGTIVGTATVNVVAP